MSVEHGGERKIEAFEIILILLFVYMGLSLVFPSLSVALSDQATIVNTLFYYLYKIILFVFPVVGFIMLGYYAHMIWLHYVRAKFISGIDFVLLEIIPPREVDRSPQAMELFFTNALYHWSDKGGSETYFQGAVWFWFSLEIVSIEGQVHFYIRTPTRIRSLIETQIYSQYPQAQVKEVDDYTLAVDEISEKSNWNLWGCEFGYSQPDIFPLRTYVDFGLDKNPKEELKVDPMVPMLELFGSMKKGEQMWLQIVIRPSKKKYKTAGTWFGTHLWVEEGKLQMRKLLAEFTRTHPPGPDGVSAKELRAPAFLDNVVKTASNKMLKVAFDTGIRACYVAKKDVFNSNNRKNLRLIFRQYAAPTQNELLRINSTQADAFSAGFISTWFSASEKDVRRLCHRMLEEYREREFYHPPLRHSIVLPWPLSPWIFPNYFHHHINVMGIEELATLWHFPGRMLRVPTLERIESKEASPPPNLPI
ncbi:MAG: hypothetical protein K9L98_02875 [Candidatus Pacebacteria bacterium]|nr:hypothetical protein [Candidatus Paceibacterota bacterium]MCF7862929.1 hypothetical protein [Candidatus Paceibacterota bacterium]